MGLAFAPRAISACANSAGTRKLMFWPSRRVATLTPTMRPLSSSTGPPLMPGFSAPENRICGRKLRSTRPLYVPSITSKPMSSGLPSEKMRSPCAGGVACGRKSKVPRRATASGGLAMRTSARSCTTSNAISCSAPVTPSTVWKFRR
jgi:hypothetical protein